MSCVKTDADVIILGGGMAGVSLAAELAGRARVVLLESEPELGRHATARSAAMFLEGYGNPTIRALSKASRAFFVTPPEEFTQTALLHPRAMVMVADATRTDQLVALMNEIPGLSGISREETLRLVPVRDPAWLAAAAIDDSGFDIDVAALIHGYLMQARRAGVQLILDSAGATIHRGSSGWVVAGRFAEVTAPTLVNSTGAWVDQVATSANVRPLGLIPHRRTAVIVPAPEGQSVSQWPMIFEVDEQFYFKPDGGRILLSPANEDPDAPGDAMPDELDVAIAVDRFERATTMQVRRITHRWAGLRTFAADRTPVVGFDAQAPGFFWLGGQGGYGIQTAPALSRLAAALILGRPVPSDILDSGVAPEALSPARFGRGIGHTT